MLDVDHVHRLRDLRVMHAVIAVACFCAMVIPEPVSGWACLVLVFFAALASTVRFFSVSAAIDDLSIHDKEVPRD